ncbi:MAG TPA: hypothetical protein VMU34_07335 [Mycobacterium sp.]|nr:hypothetical protein [Mycobacterium sp.]
MRIASGRGRSGATGSTKCQGVLLAEGIKRGDVIAFVDKNTPTCLEVTLGTSAMGAIDAVVN